jgi:signal transduction histidine kinase
VTCASLSKRLTRWLIALCWLALNGLAVSSAVWAQQPNTALPNPAEQGTSDKANTNIIIDQAQALITVDGASELSLVALPYHWDRMHHGASGQAMLEVAFELSGEPSVPYAALLSRVGNRYEIWLNGTLLSRSGELGVAGSADYAKAPRYVPIPPQILQKYNLLRIHLDVDGGRRGGLSAVTVGTEQSIRALYEASYRWRVAGALVVLIVMLLVGAVAAALWLTQHGTVGSTSSAPASTVGAAPQRDRMYAYAALGALCWALRLSNFLITTPPLDWPGWGVLMTLALSGAIFYIMLFAAYVAQWQQQRWVRVAERCVPPLLLVCAAISAWGYHAQQLKVLTLWFSATTLLSTAFIVAYVLSTLRSTFSSTTFKGTIFKSNLATGHHHTLRAQWLLAASMAVNLLLNIYDLYIYRISQALVDNPLSYYTSVLYGLTMFYIVVTRFRAASAQARELLHTLEQRIADKETQLAGSYQQLELLARDQERSAERTRILRDMHDGVGSHISAAIRQLQSGKATDGEVLTTLRDSLDQLKLSIDSMHLVPGDVTALLANMRYRLEPRFVSSGIAFEWDVDMLPSIDRLEHSALRQLQYMAFETLSNVLQHSAACTLRIEARVLTEPTSAHTAVVRFIDDGKGFDTQAITTRGLASMRERALAIGAQLVLHSVPGRTVVEIYL